MISLEINSYTFKSIKGFFELLHLTMLLFVYVLLFVVLVDTLKCWKRNSMILVEILFPQRISSVIIFLIIYWFAYHFSNIEVHQKLSITFNDKILPQTSKHSFPVICTLQKRAFMNSHSYWIKKSSNKETNK